MIPLSLDDGNFLFIELRIFTDEARLVFCRILDRLASKLGYGRLRRLAFCLSTEIAKVISTEMSGSVSQCPSEVVLVK